MSRMIRTACVAALAAAGLTGCAQIDTYSVRDEHAAQTDVIGDVVALGATFCLDDQIAPVLKPQAAAMVVGPGGDGTCDPALAPGEALPSGIADDGGAQFFAAFLVPDNAVAPATATAHLPAAFDAQTVTLTRKRSLDETLEHTRPAPAGRHWVGYISPVVGGATEFPTLQALELHLRHASETPLDQQATSGDWTAAADFKPARGDGGFPSPTTFGHAVIGGTRVAYPESLYEGTDLAGLPVDSPAAWGAQLLDSRPVNCQELLAFPFGELFGQPLPASSSGLRLLPTTLCGRQSADAALALKDLRGSGGVGSVAPGATATVPFTLRYAGEAGPTFALSATSAIPGATVTPSTPALTPAAAGFQDVGVQVAVPAGTTPGDYAVTLTATVGDQVRKALGTLTVTAPRTTAASGLAGEKDQGTVGGAGTPPTAPGRGRYVEFRGFDRSGLGPDGQSINLGDVFCHKREGSCAFITVQLSVRWEQLHVGAEAARAAAAQRVRMVVIGTTHLSVPAQGRRRVRVTVPKSVRRMLSGGEILHAVVGVRPAHNVLPIVHRIALQRG